MAENQTRPMDRVRDMYERDDPREMNERDKKAHIERTLQENLDVLFRIYQFRTVRRLHMVIFSTTHPAEWMRFIQSRAANHSLQLTKRRDVNNIFTVTMSGPEEALQTLCEEFDQLHGQVMDSIQNEEEAVAAAAAQGNPEDDVEELKDRIRELELENRNLQKQ